MKNIENIDAKKIFDLMRALPLIGITCGFLLTSNYFFNIGYFPQNDINSFILIFIYVSTICFLIAGAISFLSITGAVIWVRHIFGNPRISRWLINTQELPTAYEISIGNTSDKSTTKEKTMLKILAYYVATLSISVLIIGAILNAQWQTKTIYAIGISALIVGAISFFMAPAFLYKHQWKDRESIEKYTSNLITTKRRKLDYASFFFEYTGITIITLFFLCISITTALHIAPTKDRLFELVVSMYIIFISGYWCVFTNGNSSPLKNRIIYFIGFCAIIIFFTHEQLIISVVNIAQLSSPNTDIFVDYETCTLFKDLGKINQCYKNQPTKISHINIKWRGAEQYITFSDERKAHTGENHHLIIPGTAIKGSGY